MSHYQTFLDLHPNQNVGSTHWNIFCASNRLLSLETLKEKIDEKNSPAEVLDNASHHYSTKQVAKTFERLHEKYFGVPPRERWFGEDNREKFNKLRKFLNENDLDLNSHISMNMQALANFCTYRGMPFRVSMLTTKKSLTRSLSKMRDNVRSVGNAHYEGADLIHDSLYESEFMLAEHYFAGVEGDDPDLHRLGIRNASSLTAYYIACTPRMFEYVLDHEVIEYSTLELLDAVTAKMQTGKFKSLVEEKHYEARILAAYQLCETLSPGSAKKVLVKKNMNMLTPKFWQVVREGFRATTVKTTTPTVNTTVDSSLGMSLYG